MNDECTIIAKSAEKSRFCGSSLVHTLYARPVTIALTGEMGAGKTTFLQGFADELGIREPLTSPTYALEQRYRGTRDEIIHIDLYRLSERQAEELLRGTESFTGIRCIEWSQRVQHDDLIGAGPVIHVDIQEDADPALRTIRCVFHDAAFPSDEQIARWRSDVKLPAHIIDHCEAVAGLCDRYAQYLISRGRIVRPAALKTAALVHDLLRFLDFHLGGHAAADSHPREHVALWESLRQRFPGMHHEEACAAFLRERGYPVIASIVTPHGLRHAPATRTTIEQQLLYYADKRVMLDRVVSLEERFADFAQRYGKGIVSEDHKRWYAEVKDAERELFPDGLPF